ncbi:alpha/beta-hydrolase [Laetiporus sulphureus 93-53]|uniref:Alpha/beta-hydrolase n=1 Tax=Laetiporus sulphureus 93-53 TaxID=1314785 RepID=A0A165II16_9APHY|nr:alpha/beta-hydrolase [Laetiporus sulphureus 93-53]KZT13104.1 alpha/beta-hydrolase [Laetiporus sulphureus 93-53]
MSRQDPAAIAVLLEQLKASQVWQDIVNPKTQNTATPSTNTSSVPSSEQSSGAAVLASPKIDTHAIIGGSAAADATAAPSSTVASLLSQLRGTSSYSGSSNPIHPHVQYPATCNDYPPSQVTTITPALPEPGPSRPLSTPTVSSARREDLRNLSYKQTLPHLARLSEDPGFVEAISTLKKEQAELERQLWEERQAIQCSHEEKVKVARTKASMIGAGLTQYEADTMSAAFRQELQKFDAERVLPAWDGLVSKQQAKLEAFGVPTMYPTVMIADRETSANLLVVMISRSPRSLGPTACCATVSELWRGSIVRRLAYTSGAYRPVIRGNDADGNYQLDVLQRQQCCQSIHTLPPFGSLLFATMPYVDLVSSDDYTSIWYTTNSPNGNVGGFDPAKPTIVMLHPVFLDSTWLHPQMDDHRLNSCFNIIIFDTRSTGKSLSRPTGRHDLWVNAADLAHCFHHLCLPPAHMFAPELNAYAALRLAALFPDLLLSLTLVNIPAQTEIRTVFEAFEELTQLWSFSEDLESFEYSCKELLDFFAGQDAHPDLQDELVAYWEVHYPPFRRSHVITNVNLFMNRRPLTPEELACVTCPTLIIQAERSQTHPLEYAERVANSLVNVPGGCTVFSVKGKASQGYLSIISASIVNQVFNKFLARQPPARSDSKRPSIPLAERMKAGLAKLAQLRNEPTFVDRDPLSPLSFSCVSPEVCKSQEETRATYQKEERTAFSPLGLDGRPLRKFSERKDHWLDSGSDGYSYSSAQLYKEKKRQQKPSRRRDDNDVGIMLPPSEPVSEEQQVSRLRRATINPSAVDKQVIKGSMAKVVATGGNMPLPRLLR